ncbi:UPF0104 family protein [Lusitaniella coriacea LEGE 07157]|uniref:UPF0104 family protein n=1 Tax=Lusitaniella coriacea LEGE 07157 TaxID=945747 RepID=A0A8J7DZF9_9CYAN|nr:lysylphosphatidylglycerol synthase domain-containing protein [Lusitaniella coriacea]MBE9118100.1 UPF0104 family protein [Lusitaniella coriacea LEGE 07157]
MTFPYRKRISQIIPVLVGLILLNLSVRTISQEVRNYPPGEILKSFTTIPALSIVLAVGLTLLNYVALTGYDTLAVRLLRRPLAYRQTALAGGISYAISNSVGFTFFSGSVLRYRFYARWGFSIVQIAQIIAFCNLSFWIGLFAVAGVFFLVNPPAVPNFLDFPFDSIHFLGGIFLSCLLGYLGWSAINRKKRLKIGRWKLPYIPLTLALAQVGVTMADWVLVAGVLYALLPQPISVSYPAFCGIYVLARLAGIMSNVPGGLGVFEVVILSFLSPPIASGNLLGSILVYRSIYYFLPFAIAVLLLSFYESRQRSDMKSG